MLYYIKFISDHNEMNINIKCMFIFIENCNYRTRKFKFTKERGHTNYEEVPTVNYFLGKIETKEIGRKFIVPIFILISKEKTSSISQVNT